MKIVPSGKEPKLKGGKNDWKGAFDINFFGPLYGIRGVLPEKEGAEKPQFEFA
jgi:hypothetical protein